MPHASDQPPGLFPVPLAKGCILLLPGPSTWPRSGAANGGAGRRQWTGAL